MTNRKSISLSLAPLLGKMIVGREKYGLGL
jgi:hypothetical protein